MVLKSSLVVVWTSLICVCAIGPRFSPATVGMDVTSPNPNRTSAMMAPGKFAWEYPTATSVEATVAVANCSGSPCVLFGDYSGVVHALHAETGKGGIWTKPYQAGEMIRSSIKVFGSSMFFLDGDSKLYSLDVNTGTEQWIFKTSAPPQQFACSSPVVVTRSTSSQLGDAIVMVGSVDGALYAVNSSTGQQIWLFQTSQAIYASPVTTPDNTTVFIGSDDGIMYAVHVATGKQVWQFQSGDMIRSGSAVWNGVLYFGANDGVLYALDVLTGGVRFRFNTQSYITAIPLVEELVPNQQAVVYIGSYDNSMYSVNATTGVKLWSYKITDSIMAPAAVFTPSLTNRVTLYFGGADSYYYAVDARTGSFVWKFNVNAPVWSRGVIVQGVQQPNVVFGAQLDPDFGGQCGVWAVSTQ